MFSEARPSFGLHSAATFVPLGAQTRTSPRIVRRSQRFANQLKIKRLTIYFTASSRSSFPAFAPSASTARLISRISCASAPSSHPHSRIPATLTSSHILSPSSTQGSSPWPAQTAGNDRIDSSSRTALLIITYRPMQPLLIDKEP